MSLRHSHSPAIAGAKAGFSTSAAYRFEKIPDFPPKRRRTASKRDFPRTLTPAVLMGCPSIGRYRAVQAVAALWKLKGSRSVISASPAR